MYTTITIRKETKELLAKLKGKRDWDSFLRELVLKNLSNFESKLRKLSIDLDLPTEEIRVKKWAREF